MVQVRKEAGPIYYAENKFEISIHHFDSEPGCFAAVKRRFVSDEFNGLAVKVSTTVYQTPHWQNLATWAYNYHRGRTSSALAVNPLNPDTWLVGGHTVQDSFAFNVMNAMFQMVRAMRGQPWSTVWPLVLNFRPILAQDHIAWQN